MTDITLLDGGMGQELVARSGKPPSPRWSTQVMIDAPGLVGEVHTDYANSGATVATTNTYAIHRDRLRGGADNHYAAEGTQLPDIEDQMPDLLDAALNEADSVRDRSRVAASIGPLGASYRSDLHPDVATATPLYAELVHHMAPRVDLFLFETVASIEAAQACLNAGREEDRPVWLSLTVDDNDGTRLRSGEALEDVLPIASQADAVLANCSLPEVMPEALNILSRAGVPFGAYANGFTRISDGFMAGGNTVSDLTARTDLTPEKYADHVMDWVEQGATIVGGCCEVGPAHIAEMAKRLQAAGHRLV
jgi:homocysteine S-methyltransferase